MNIKNDKINLANSFEKLKVQLEISQQCKNDPETIAFGLGLLQGAVKLHLKQCTEETSDDIPRELFKQ